MGLVTANTVGLSGLVAPKPNVQIFKTAGTTIFFKGPITHLDTDGNSNAVVFSDGNSNSVISLVTPQSYVIDLVGASATVYHVSGFISDVTVPTIADA